MHNDEELPNLADPDVQNATLAIQKAYMKKKDLNKDKKAEVVKKVEVEAAKEEAEEMPNLEDPDVRKATLKIQNAYIKKKSRQSLQKNESKK